MEHVERQIVAMLSDTRHAFDAAMSSLVGGADPATLRDDIVATDRRVNQAESEIRRELIVHASVHGSTEIGVLMAYLLAVKKIERLGDQTKNVFELAEEGVNLVDAPDRDGLIAQRDEISELIGQSGEIFTDRDEDRAAELISQGSALLDRLDAEVKESLHSDAPASVAVPRALLARYLKRIVANVMGVVSMVTRPIDERKGISDDID